MRNRSDLFLIALAMSVLAGTACFRMLPTRGGGHGVEAKVDAVGGRKVDPGDVALPRGYRIEAVARGLTFPTDATFDDAGRLHVIEAGYSYGEVFKKPRLLRIEGGRPVVVAESPDANGPWTGVVFHDGAFYVSEGGEAKGGKILRIAPDGKITALVEDLPSMGDHHTNQLAIRDGFVYFGIGTATNSGVVGGDSWAFGWLKRHPKFHDIPCEDVTLAGANFETENPFTEDPKDRAVTGAFVPFGTPTTKGQVVKGQVPCSGAVLRVPLAGGKPELVAWGFRNVFGIGFASDGTLYATENGFDVRGSRPVFGAADNLYEVVKGRWYGWPDFSAGLSLDDERWDVPGADEKRPSHLLAKHPNPAPTPIARFGVHSSSNGFDISRNGAFGHVGHLFVAQFGDMSPETGKVYAPVGFKVVRVDPTNGVIEEFATNKSFENGPASKWNKGGLERPVSVRFDREGSSLYVVDFGIMTIGKKPEPREQTGVVWRIAPVRGVATK